MAPEWASTSTKTAYTDVYYVEALSAGDTVHQPPQPCGYKDHGQPERGYRGAEQARAVMAT